MIPDRLLKCCRDNPPLLCELCRDNGAAKYPAFFEKG